MLKKLSLGAASASVLALGVTATPANAAIHFFSFEAPTEFSAPFPNPNGPGQLVKALDFSGHLSFDELGVGFLSLDLDSSLDPDIPSFSGGPGAVTIANYTAGGSTFELSGQPIGSDLPATTLLTFDFGTAVLPNLADLSAFLAGDVTATATIGADVLAAILPQVTPGFEDGVISQVDDVTFTKKAPEPSATLAFLGLGLATVGFKLRRKASV